MAELSDKELLDALGVSAERKKASARTPREERIIAGFEEIQRFVDEEGRLPTHGEDKGIFERLYATRLDRIQALEECRLVVQDSDHQDLLEGEVERSEAEKDLDDASLLAELGVDAEPKSEVAQLKHVKPRADVRAAEEIAARKRCEDFESFKPLFERVQTDLDSGVRETRPFELKAEIEKGRFFVVGGQKAYVAEKGDVFTNAQGRTDARLRVIFDNGTESNMLMRSLQRSLNKDDAGRRITESDPGPLFAGSVQEGDTESGTIYVLRSKSDNPSVAENRELIHKIGVTSGDVEKRIAGARLQPTFLMADVEIVATYTLYNINRIKLENLLHRFFASARIDIEIRDRFGNPVVPREWFLIPLFVIDETVERIRDGTIADYHYDAESASLRKSSG